MSNSILIERSHSVTSCALFRSNLLINSYVLSFSDLSISHYFMSSVTGQIDTVYQVDKITILSIIHSIYERWWIGSRSTASALLVLGCFPLFSSTDRSMLKEPSHHVYFLGPTPSVSFHSQEQPAVCGCFFFSLRTTSLHFNTLFFFPRWPDRWMWENVNVLLSQAVQTLIPFSFISSIYPHFSLKCFHFSSVPIIIHHVEFKQETYNASPWHI